MNPVTVATVPLDSPVILSPIFSSSNPSILIKSSLDSTTKIFFSTKSSPSLTKITSLSANLALFWTGAKVGYLDLLMTLAYPDWYVLAIPGFVLTPIKSNSRTSGFIAW